LFEATSVALQSDKYFFDSSSLGSADNGIHQVTGSS
jgi:hypothetical protein